jgi:prepilin-type processing-associated H-X9-DG protein
MPMSRSASECTGDFPFGIRTQSLRFTRAGNPAPGIVARRKSSIDRSAIDVMINSGGHQITIGGSGPLFGCALSGRRINPANILFWDGSADLFYLRSPEPAPVGANVDPLGLRMGARVFPEAFPTLGPVTAPVVPGVLHVGVLFTDEPTDGATDEPTDGATTDPPPKVCASASVLVRANAVASAIVVSFMVVSFLFRQGTIPASVLSFH